MREHSFSIFVNEDDFEYSVGRLPRNEEEWERFLSLTEQAFDCKKDSLLEFVAEDFPT